nr:FAD-dependent oxidoreductase [Paraflavitalea speifideiaquila]
MSYLLCRQAIYDLQEVCQQLPTKSAFTLRPSFQFASYNNDVKGLEKEYLLRKRAGFNLQLLSETEISHLFGFSKPAGLLSADGGAVEAYELTHALLKHGQDKGMLVYDNTLVTGLDFEENGVVLQTEWGYKVKAKQLVIACGYESHQYLPKKIEKLHSTYSIISEPFNATDYWHQNALIWETANPYLYMRITADQRILVGGKDDPFTIRPSAMPVCHVKQSNWKLHLPDYFHRSPSVLILPGQEPLPAPEMDCLILDIFPNVHIPGLHWDLAATVSPLVSLPHRS